MNVKKNQNIILHESSISRKDRKNINGHKGTIIWFTGLSGSGKSTLAYALEYILHKNKSDHDIKIFLLLAKLPQLKSCDFCLISHV